MLFAIQINTNWKATDMFHNHDDRFQIIVNGSMETVIIIIMMALMTYDIYEHNPLFII